MYWICFDSFCALPFPLAYFRDFAIVSFTLLLSMIELKTMVMRDDLEGALALLPNIPQVSKRKVVCRLDAFLAFCCFWLCGDRPVGADDALIRKAPWPCCKCGRLCGLGSSLAFCCCWLCGDRPVGADDALIRKAPWPCCKCGRLCGLGSSLAFCCCWLCGDRPVGADDALIWRAPWPCCPTSPRLVICLGLG